MAAQRFLCQGIASPLFCLGMNGGTFTAKPKPGGQSLGGSSSEIETETDTPYRPPNR